MSSPHIPYLSDASDDEWVFVAHHPALLPEEVSPCKYDLHQAFDDLRYLVKTSVPPHVILPDDLPPWPVVCQELRP